MRPPRNRTKSPGKRAEEHEGFDRELELIVEIINDDMRERREKKWGELDPRISAEFAALRAGAVERQTAVARYIFQHRARLIRRISSPRVLPMQIESFPTFKALMACKLSLGADELTEWLVALGEELSGQRWGWTRINLGDWPLTRMLSKIEAAAKADPLSSAARQRLQAILDWPQMSERNGRNGTDFVKLRARVEALLDASEDAAVLRPYTRLAGDGFGDAMEQALADLPSDQAEIWHRLLNHAATASGAKPSRAWREASRTLLEPHGKTRIRSLIQSWLERAIAAKSAERVVGCPCGRPACTFEKRFIFTDNNIIALKGLVWICDGFRDRRTVGLVANLCDVALRNLPGRGPAAQATANACLWYLETTPGQEAAARLSALTTTVKNKGVQARLREGLANKAEKAGLTSLQLEERVVPDHGFSGGSKHIAFGDDTLELTVEGPGRVTQRWSAADGATRKSVPKSVRESASHTANLKKARAEVAATKKLLTAQRDRIDRLFAEKLSWPLEEVERYYVGHALLGPIAQRYIWLLELKRTAVPALYREGRWEDVEGRILDTSGALARLWHPVEADIETVMAWRARLAGLGIVQPSKQAHREVYLLTDAERRTGTYSNRMAAHLVKQHQLGRLMVSRGWRHTLVGSFDDGFDDQWATKTVHSSPLRAEYLITSTWNNDDVNATGIYLHVGTDQIRFVGPDDVAAPLTDVPLRLFSEIMREADLFVGVASVGNDPAWVEQGPTPAARDYWHAYAFGDLDGFAETRKAVLEAVLPRLRIHDRCRIEGRFLVVDGTHNRYRIHLGSSNILMDPGERYLCIVPGPATPNATIALPFEGDGRLAVILSKAVMLAEDDRIDTPDIRSQIRRR
ncbi:MAG: DUF4132 domain-containing protein [Pseudomonadota bacterium]